MRNVAVLLAVGFALLLAIRLASALRPTAAVRERFLANRAALLNGALFENAELPSAAFELCRGAEFTELLGTFGDSRIDFVEHGARARMKSATPTAASARAAIGALARAMHSEAALFTQERPFEPPEPGYAVAYYLTADGMRATLPIPIEELRARRHPLARAFSEAQHLSRTLLYRSFG